MAITKRRIRACGGDGILQFGLDADPGCANCDRGAYYNVIRPAGTSDWQLHATVALLFPFAELTTSVISVADAVTRAIPLLELGGRLRPKVLHATDSPNLL
jgi:hypothetical protein